MLQRQSKAQFLLAGRISEQDANAICVQELHRVPHHKHKFKPKGKSCAEFGKLGDPEEMLLVPGRGVSGGTVLLLGVGMCPRADGDSTGTDPAQAVDATRGHTQDLAPVPSSQNTSQKVRNRGTRSSSCLSHGCSAGWQELVAGP